MKGAGCTYVDFGVTQLHELLKVHLDEATHVNDGLGIRRTEQTIKPNKVTLVIPNLCQRRWSVGIQTRESDGRRNNALKGHKQREGLRVQILDSLRELVDGGDVSNTVRRRQLCVSQLLIGRLGSAWSKVTVISPAC